VNRTPLYLSVTVKDKVVKKVGEVTEICGEPRNSLGAEHLWC